MKLVTNSEIICSSLWICYISFFESCYPWLGYNSITKLNVYTIMYYIYIQLLPTVQFYRIYRDNVCCSSDRDYYTYKVFKCCKFNVKIYIYIYKTYEKIFMTIIEKAQLPKIISISYLVHQYRQFNIYFILIDPVQRDRNIYRKSVSVKKISNKNEYILDV